MGDRGGNKIVDAFVPLAEMFGYSTWPSFYDSRKEAT